MFIATEVRPVEQVPLPNTWEDLPTCASSVDMVTNQGDWVYGFSERLWTRVGLSVLKIVQPTLEVTMELALLAPVYVAVHLYQRDNEWSFSAYSRNSKAGTIAFKARNMLSDGITRLYCAPRLPIRAIP